MSPKNQKVIGMLFALLCGIVAIAVAVWIDRDAMPILAIFMVGWGLARSSRSNNPLLAGVVLGIAYLGLGIVIWFVKDAIWIWSMALFSFLVDNIVGYLD